MAKRTCKTKRTRVTAIKANWYKNPRMNGHHWAIESHRLASGLKALARTKKQKEFLNASINFSNTDWHYWCNWVSKKDVAQVKHVLKSIAKGGTWAENYHWVNERHAMIMDGMTRFLEVAYYDENPEAYIENAIHWNVSMGMDREMAVARAENRIAKYRDKLGL